jgi:hypothetical protein
VKDQVLKTCKLLLAPAVRLLLRAGLGWKDFAEIGKQVFVEVARQDYGLKGRPTNSARVALMTGLSRREIGRIVRVLKGDDEAPSPRQSRISQILTGWHVDPEFRDSDGGPAVLPESGASGSLASLLDRYAGDIPHGALIKEMLQLGLMRHDESGYAALARDYIRAASDPDLLRQGGRAIHDHATTILHNVAADRSGPARFERMATRLEVDREHAAEFERMLAERGQEFLEEMDAWLAERGHARAGASANRKPVRTGVGMYLIYDETQGTKDND